MKTNYKLVGTLFLLPALTAMILFLLLPIIMTVCYSFTDWNGLDLFADFVGLKNYISVLKDPVFLQLLKNTFVLTIFYIPVLNILALLFAILINEMVRFKNLVKVFLFLPNMLSAVVVGFTWLLIYEYNIGLLNNVLEHLGLEFLKMNWLGKPNLVLISIGITILWTAVGFYMLIYQAGLNTIPDEIYEAAELDGAGWWQKHIFITAPMMSEHIRTNLILSIIGILGIFELPYIMTGGGPLHMSETVAVRIYLYSFRENLQERGLALAVMMAIITMLITLIILKSGKNGEPDNE